MVSREEVKALQQQVALFREQAAYARLYRVFFPSLLQFSHAFVKSKEAAEEIVSDVFLNIWQLDDKLVDIHNLTVYLYTSTRNLSLNYLLKRKREITCVLDEAGMAVASPAADPEQQFITAELANKIELAIRQLPPKCRLVFKLVKEDGLKYKEVAAVLRISVKTVETQMGIALKRIGQAIQASAACYGSSSRASKRS